MFNSSSSAFCPLLQTMLDHSLNNNTGVNLVVVWVHGLVSCLGILENALVLWVVGFRLRRRTVASVWVLNLALSDFLATLTLPLFTHYLHSSHSWELGGLLCTAQSSVFFLNMFVSAFLLAAISLDRCLLVARPVWSQNHRSISAAWKVCALGWLWAAANTFPYVLFRAVTEKTDGRKLCYHHFGLYSSPGMLERDCRVRQAATAVSKTLLAFLLPLVVIAGSYALFGISLSQRRKRRRNNSSSRLTGALIVTNVERRESKPNTNTKSSTPNPKGSTPTSTSVKLSSRRTEPSLSRGFTKMVTSVIATFALCWAPYHVFCLIEVAAQYWPTKVVLVEVGLPIATTFAFLNPVLNPVLYAFSCPNFCVRIRQSLGALMEGLVEEGGMGGVGEGGLGLSIRKGWRKGRGSLGGNSLSSPSCLGTPGSPHLQEDHLPSSASINHNVKASCGDLEQGEDPLN
ncbi:prostaglandin D2 receptor 2-like isoform X1 [Oncorhynchus mykiss]|uniref:G-protein coupled receptors family 1 profile domain-containing protein n=2 Tax=Oncorhynchus mykiss TaxID=8022 RepID=A0A8C7P064_ONCMY|nr:prostaglandin D2 receptor 2-like isoform X1 [Oncorhynchus mykiss]